jgi:hypothetical protein
MCRPGAISGYDSGHTKEAKNLALLSLARAGTRF